MFMVLAKSTEEMKHIETVVAYICAAAVFIVCAFLLAYLIERRITEAENRKRIQLEIRLRRTENEVDREERNFRSINFELEDIITQKNRQLVEKNKKIEELELQCEDYRRQLDEVKLGSFNGRSLNRNGQNK